MNRFNQGLGALLFAITPFRKDFCRTQLVNLTVFQGNWEALKKSMQNLEVLITNTRLAKVFAKKRESALSVTNHLPCLH